MLRIINSIFRQNQFVFYCSSSKFCLMESIAEVDIDQTGKFKYILIKIIESKTNKEKLVVRGYGRCNYHGDIFDEVEPSFEKAGCKADCLGGGRIIHDPDKKTLKVFGYSTGYGKADHSKSVEVLKKSYPSYDITWSDDGY